MLSISTTVLSGSGESGSSQSSNSSLSKTKKQRPQVEDVEDIDKVHQDDDFSEYYSLCYFQKLSLTHTVTFIYSSYFVFLYV